MKFQFQLMCVIGAVTESTFVGARIAQGGIPARKPRATDVLRKWENSSQIVKIRTVTWSGYARDRLRKNFLEVLLATKTQ